MTAKTNPFDTEDTVKPKQTPEVVETPEDKAGTAQDKPADAPETTLHADGTRTDPAEDAKKAEEQKKAETKPKKKRRTKAEIEAAKAAKEGVEPSLTSGVESVDSPVDFNALDFEKLPLSFTSGNVTGSVVLNQGAVPILQIALVNWIGEPPVSIAAEQLGDVEKVISELKKQARSAKR